MNNNIILPKISEIMQNPENDDALKIVSSLRKKVSKLPGDFLYLNPIDLKLGELENCIKYVANDQPFVFKMKNEWAPEIRYRLIKKNIKFDIIIRRKSLFSTLLKMNRIMAEKKAIDSIHDLMGMEIIVDTNGPVDTQKSIDDCYDTMNTVLSYFMTATEHRPDRFLLCESTGVKGTVPNFDLDERQLTADEKRALIKVKNPNLFIPEESGILPDFRNFCKDYNLQPKIKSFYSGLQASVCYVTKAGKRYYFEIQVKSQNQRDFLNEEFIKDVNGNLISNPGYHNNFRELQNEINESMVDSSTPQFDLTFIPEKCYHICGFRENPAKDRSGILAAKSWSICNSTHQN